MALAGFAGLTPEVRYRLSDAVVNQRGVVPLTVDRYIDASEDSGDDLVTVRRDDLAALLEVVLG